MIDQAVAPVLEAQGLSRSYGHVVALDECDFALYPGEVLAVIGDNGAGKSTLIRCLAGADTPDSGVIKVAGEPVEFSGPQAARAMGIETVYQNLAVSPALDIVANMFLGREKRKPGVLGSVFRMLDRNAMTQETTTLLSRLGVTTLQSTRQLAETLSGGQRQSIAVSRAAAFAREVVIMDEPTAALGVRESERVLQLIRDIRSDGLAVILISHNMPHIFEVADRIHIQRLGRSVGVVSPNSHTMSQTVALMTGATDPADDAHLKPVRSDTE